MEIESIAIDRTFQARKWFLVGILVAALSATGVWFREQAKIQTGPQTEIGKILYLFQLYREKDFKIIFNGTTYDMETAVQRARMFLAAHYQGEKAAAWIRSRLYRSPDKREVIYVAFPNGSRRPLRDVLIETLNELPVK